jgi:DNA helicase HerA-like ATPase
MRRGAERVSIIGRVDFRNDRRQFGIRQADRLFHLYALGKTGTGKTNLLETLARQDIAAGRGLALIDPHGDLAARLAAAVPEERRGDLLYRKRSGGPV